MPQYSCRPVILPAPTAGGPSTAKRLECILVADHWVPGDGAVLAGMDQLGLAVARPQLAVRYGALHRAGKAGSRAAGRCFAFRGLQRNRKEK